jgi:hypothetical protein
MWRLTYPPVRAPDHRDVPVRIYRRRSREQQSCLVQSLRGFSRRGLDRLGRDDYRCDPQNKAELRYCKLLAAISVGSPTAIDAGGCLLVCN